MAWVTSDRNAATFRLMHELTMAATRRMQGLSIAFDHLNDVAHFHHGRFLENGRLLGRPLWVIGIPNCRKTAGNQLPRMRSRAILSRLTGGTCRTSGHRDISLCKVTRTGAAAPEAGLYQERGIQKRAVAATCSTGARIRQPGRTGHRQRCCPGSRSRERSAIWAGNISV